MCIQTDPVSDSYVSSQQRVAPVARQTAGEVSPQRCCRTLSTLPDTTTSLLLISLTRSRYPLLNLSRGQGICRSALLQAAPAARLGQEHSQCRGQALTFSTLQDNITSLIVTPFACLRHPLLNFSRGSAICRRGMLQAAPAARPETGALSITWPSTHLLHPPRHHHQPALDLPHTLQVEGGDRGGELVQRWISL